MMHVVCVTCGTQFAVTETGPEGRLLCPDGCPTYGHPNCVPVTGPEHRAGARRG